MATVRLKSVRPTGSPPGNNVSLLGVDDSAANDSETVNYTGAAVSPPTGYTIFSSNQAINAANAAGEPVGPGSVGWVSAVKGAASFVSANKLPLASIAAGTWTVHINFGGTGLLGPTVSLGIKIWKADDTPDSETVVQNWTYVAGLTAANADAQITFNPGAVAFGSGKDYLYVETILRVTTGGTNLSANAITISAIRIDIPAVGFARGPSESVTSSSDSIARAQVLARGPSESVTASADTVTRLYSAARTVTEVATPTAAISGSDYDGSNNYATRGANLTGISSTVKKGLISCWLRLDGSDATAMRILSTSDAVAGGVDRINIGRNASNKFTLSAVNNAGTQVLSIATAASYVAGASLIHLIASWDLAVPGSGHIYVNDASDYAETTFVNDNWDTVLGDWAVGARPNGTNKWNGCIYEFFFHTAYLDLSVTANRRQFRSVSGNAVPLGTDGSAPLLGVVPLIYAPSGNPATNKGSGGNFVMNGSVAAASTAPGGTTSTLAADTVTRQTVLARTITESVASAADTVTRQTVLARTATDSVASAADTVTRQTVLARTTTESVASAADTVTRQTVLARTATESVASAADTIARAQVLARSVSESIAASADVVSRLYHAFRTVTEDVDAANDTPTRIANFNRDMSESVGSAADTIARMFSGARAVVENVTAANDSVARTFQANREITETISSGGGGTTVVRRKVIVYDKV